MKKEVFSFLKKYYFASVLVIIVLMFMHYPNIFFKGNSFEYIVVQIEKEYYLNIIVYFITLFAYALLFMPYLIFSKVKYIGWIPLAIFSIFTGLEKYIFYLQGNHTPWNVAFNEDMLINFMVNPTGLKDSFETYGSDYHFYLYLFIFPLFIFISLMFIRSKLPSFNKKDIYKIVMSIMAGMILLTPTFFNAPIYIPYMFRVHSTILFHYVEKIYELTGITRQEPYFNKIIKKETPQNIIFIADESVRGDLISINNPTEEKVMLATSYLYSIKEDIINFGNLYSTVNCSYPSNEMSMIGLNSYNYNTIPNYVKKTPTIFQYMQQAGYKTYLLDNVHNGLYMVLKNYDRKYLNGLLNNFEEFQLLHGYDRDFKTLDELKVLLNNGEKNFIYIIKYGIHFPFKNAFDESKPLFKKYGKNNQEEEFNLYLNGLHIAVDKYWEYLVKISKNTDSVFLYQSDHSVNITANKDKSNIRITHCENGFTYYQEMHSIPGILYSPNKKWYQGFKALPHGYSASHMFPTLLYFAGYDNKDYTPIYGNDFRNPETFVEVRNYDTYYRFGDNNTSNVYDKVNLNIMKSIHPLNKKRILPNTLPNRHFIIENNENL